MTPTQLNESLSNIEVAPTLQQDIQHKQSISNGSTSTNNLVDNMIAANEPGQNIKISDIIKKRQEIKKGSAEKQLAQAASNDICKQIVEEIIEAIDLDKLNVQSTTSSKNFNPYEITAESIMNKHKKFNE